MISLGLYPLVAAIVALTIESMVRLWCYSAPGSGCSSTSRWPSSSKVSRPLRCYCFEQLLGQRDMLYMAGGGRISRVHGPFVSDEEVEKVVRHLKTQGQPEYLEAVTAEEPTDEDGAVFDSTGMGGGGGGDLFSQAVAIVKRDRKASTSYIQRRLQIGYNRAASLMERIELEGIVGQANHAGKREILVEEEEGGF